MLKRQRPSSPLPVVDVSMPESMLDIDVFERITKRRRHFAPPRSYNVQRDSFTTSGIGQNEHEEETGQEFSRSQRHWQQDAGLYKDANTLLHDLHAEQRHRAIFSTSSTAYPQSLPPHTYASPAQRSPKHIMTPALGRTIHTPHSDQYSPDCAPATYRTSESAEAQIVSQHYEDTNRLLATLAESRRRRHNMQQRIMDS